MGTKQVLTPRVALACAALPTLSTGAYCVSDAYNCTTNRPQDVVIDIDVATTNLPAGNKQVVVFIKESLDGTNYRSGPESGTTTTEENALRWIGTVPVNTSAYTYRATFSILSALGYVPAFFKVVVKNDLGVLLTSGTLNTAEVSYLPS
jgi:hypothetical protein